MPPKHLSRAQKRKRKQREEALVQHQAGDMFKYLNSSKITQREEIVKNLGETTSIEEQETWNDNANEQGDLVDELNRDKDDHVDVNELNEEAEDNVQHKDLLINFYDPGCWDKIDQNMRDLLVEKGPKEWMESCFLKIVVVGVLNYPNISGYCSMVKQMIGDG